MLILLDIFRTNQMISELSYTIVIPPFLRFAFLLCLPALFYLYPAYFSLHIHHKYITTVNFQNSTSSFASAFKLCLRYLPTPTFLNTTLLLVQNLTILCTLSELPPLALSVSCIMPSTLRELQNVRPWRPSGLPSPSLLSALYQAQLYFPPF